MNNEFTQLRREPCNDCNKIFLVEELYRKGAPLNSSEGEALLYYEVEPWRCLNCVGKHYGNDIEEPYE